MSSTREGGLVRWQWSLYREGHRDRRNLALHVATVPLFVLGSAGLPISLFAGAWGAAAASAAAMILAVAAQGRGHRWEASRPVPFRGGLDVVARLFVEQWITFPRYVVSGELARAWRRAGEGGE